MSIITSIISTVVVAVINYVLKTMSSIRLFKDFRRLSTAEKTDFISHLNQSGDGVLDAYKIQTRMVGYGVKYYQQFMRNLFYYTCKNNIRLDNNDLSSFLSLSGAFICQDDGTVRINKDIWIGYLILLAGFIAVAVLSYYSIIIMSDNVHRSLEMKHYYIFLLRVGVTLINVAGVAFYLYFTYSILTRSVGAFRFVKAYRSAWERRDLFEVGEQNLYCRNKARRPGS